MKVAAVSPRVELPERFKCWPCRLWQVDIRAFKNLKGIFPRTLALRQVKKACLKEILVVTFVSRSELQ